MENLLNWQNAMLKKWKVCLTLFIVWLSKIAGNNKCMIGADGSNDYWEVTYIDKAFVKDEFGVDDWDNEINDPNYDQPLHFIIDKYSFAKKEYK